MVAHRTHRPPGALTGYRIAGRAPGKTPFSLRKPSLLSRTFADLGVSSSLLAVLHDAGITTPTPIQSATLPDALSGRDVLGRGRTGSGKTYAFCLPLVSRLAASASGRGRRMRNAPRGLILAPTRELARQIDETLAPLAHAEGLRTTVIFGGVPQGRQVAALDRGVDIVVACPGRLEDLMGQKHIRLDAVEVSVLDEADHMADLGFLPGVTRILSATPADAQRLLFSATLDAGVQKLVTRFLTDPVDHSVDDGSATPGPTAHHMIRVDDEDRVRALADLAGAHPRTVMFTRTKHGAKRLAKQLTGRGVASVDLHGNLSQNARVRNLDAFSSGQATVLVATDIAARGIHVDDVGRRHRARGPRGPAGRAQGVRPPLGPHRARRSRGHRGDHGHQRPGTRGPLAPAIGRGHCRRDRPARRRRRRDRPRRSTRAAPARALRRRPAEPGGPVAWGFAGWRVSWRLAG